MQIIDYVELHPYTNNFEGMKLKIWGYGNKKVEYHCNRVSVLCMCQGHKLISIL
jgi:hypothetical protein